MSPSLTVRNSACTSVLNSFFMFFKDIFREFAGRPLDTHGLHDAVTLFIAFSTFGVSIPGSLNSEASSLQFAFENLCILFTIDISGRFRMLAMSERNVDLLCGTKSSQIRSSPFLSFPMYAVNFLMSVSCGLLNMKHVFLRMFLVSPYFFMPNPTISGEFPLTRSNGIVVGLSCISNSVKYHMYRVFFACSRSVPQPCSYIALGCERFSSMPSN